MKILEIVADGAPGGGTTAVLGLCEDLIGMGHDVTIVTEGNSHAARRGRELGASVEELDLFRSGGALGAFFRLRSLADEYAPDVIHVHGGRAAFFAFLVPRRYPVVYTVHGFHFANKGSLKRLIFWAAEMISSSRSQFIALVSKADEEIARRYGIVRKGIYSEVIYNGVDVEGLRRARNTTKKFDVVFAARMHRQKNPLFVLDVAEILERDGYSFAIVGGGELEASVKKRAADLQLKAEFFGALGREEALGVVAQSKIYLLPSLWEGLPIGPIEAMALGLPVVASGIAGTNEVVDDGSTGTLVKDFDARLYAGAVKRYLQDSHTFVVTSEAGSQRALEKFSRSQNSTRYAEIYQDIVGRKRFR